MTVAVKIKDVTKTNYGYTLTKQAAEKAYSGLTTLPVYYGAGNKQVGIAKVDYEFPSCDLACEISDPALIKEFEDKNTACSIAFNVYSVTEVNDEFFGVKSEIRGI